MWCKNDWYKSFGWFTKPHPRKRFIALAWSDGQIIQARIQIHSEPFILFEVYCGTPPSCLKVMGGRVGWGGGPWDFSVSPRPLGFGFLGLGLRGLGPGLDNIRVQTRTIQDVLGHVQWSPGLDVMLSQECFVGLCPVRLRLRLSMSCTSSPVKRLTLVSILRSEQLSSWTKSCTRCVQWWDKIHCKMQ